MAKTIFLVRHAKSSWENVGMPDFDRPLNERGRKDAPEMARRLIKRSYGIDFFLSSPAKRAKKTAELFMKEFGANEKKILFLPSLYHATPRDFEEAIASLDNRFDRVAIFSHNPGISEFATSLTDVHIDDMPTCGIFGLSVASDAWKKFNHAEKNFLFFDYPKAGRPE
ncbi:MAG: SixA phosphatase family protein [Chitinophagales bacterium]